MTTFDDREHAFEAHFAFEEEQDFMVKARRDRLAAEWAAGLMGLKPDQVEPYVLSVVRADLEEVYTKLLADLSGAGVEVRPAEVREEIIRLTEVARQQVSGEQAA